MIKLIRNFKNQEGLLAVLAIVFIITQVWLELTMPDYMSEITMLIQTEGSKMSEILTAGGMMLLCALGSLAASAIIAICASKIAANFGGTLRKNFFPRRSLFQWKKSGVFPLPA